MQNKLYYSFNSYLQEKYSTRVHKLSLDAGFTCPNRDGTLSSSGCIFCNEKGFSHLGGKNISLQEQVKTSMELARNRFKAEKFIAYFQNGTNTYADNDVLKKNYDIIRSFEDIVGLFISTRPDCVDNEKLDLIEQYSYDYEVWLEYGLQTIHEKTLNFLNRKHLYSDFLRAVDLTSRRNIKMAVHVILGLPGETREDMIKTAEHLSRLPLSGVKLHVFHVLKDTKCETMFSQGKIKLLKEDEYVKLACDFLEHLNPKFVVLRLVSDAREEALVGPGWINRKHDVINQIEAELKRRDSYQGKIYAK